MHLTQTFRRITLLTTFGLTLLGQTLPARAAETWPKMIRIGVQAADGLVALRASGQLEKALAPHGVSVQWLTFAYGPPLVEGINAGALDVGVVGSTPPILAQAGNAPEVRYVGYSDVLSANYAIIVPANSSIKTVKDLRDKRIATAKGSQGNIFLLQALKEAGLDSRDATITFLDYSDARSAFERGDIDAWVVPDPRYADVQRQDHARTLLTIGQISVPQYNFYIATRSFAQKYPGTLRILFDTLDKQEKYALAHLDDTAALLQKNTGVSADTWRIAVPRAGWGTHYPLSTAVIAAQQKSADIAEEGGLIPHAVKVRDAVVNIAQD